MSIVNADTGEVLDLGLARLTRIEERITGAEGDGLRARWEFGHELLAARDGKGRLPNGYLTAVVDATGTSRRELSYRIKFAETFPTEDELCTAVQSFRSWWDIREKALASTVTTDLTTVEPAPCPEGQFRVITADPPWQYQNSATRGAAADHYPTLTIAQLCGDEPLPDGKTNLVELVQAKAADDCHLYLWATAPLLREAFDLIDAWGFTYKTNLAWVKTQMGMGNYFRVSHEHILFATRGRLPTNRRDLMSWFEARRGKHSAKPARFYALVEDASPGPYLELFARTRRPGQLFEHTRPGWSFWGNET